MFISKYSNQKSPHCVALYRLTGPEDDAAHRTKEFWATILDSAGNSFVKEQPKDNQDHSVKHFPEYAHFGFAVVGNSWLLCEAHAHVRSS